MIAALLNISASLKFMPGGREGRRFLLLWVKCCSILFFGYGNLKHNFPFCISYPIMGGFSSSSDSECYWTSMASS